MTDKQEVTTNQESVWAKLREPFHPDRVLKLNKSYTGRDGKYHEVMLDYVGHADVTDRLCRADPRWYWEALSYQDGQPQLDLNSETTIGLWIRLFIHDDNGELVSRLGYGSVSRDAKEPIKELIGDALRNAAMRFGVALDLWRKDLHEQNPQETQAARYPTRAQASADAPPVAQARPRPQTRPAPAPVPSGDTVQVFDLVIPALDWDQLQNELVGGKGKKKDITWGELAQPVNDHEHYLDWCLTNTRKDVDAGKAVGPWMAKALTAYAHMRGLLGGEGGGEAEAERAERLFDETPF